MSCLHLHLDFESRSCCDFKTRGLDNYAKDSTTQVLMLAWAINEQLPQLWQPHLGPMPEELAVLLTRPEVVKIAWNAEFERVIFREVLKIEIPIEQWVDPSTMAKYASIAGSLEFVGKVLGLGEDKAKLATGKKLIKLFSYPKKDETFNDWTSHPEKWVEFCDYCRQDVTAEREILKKLKAFTLPVLERRIWLLDQEINDRGIPVDRTFVAGAQKIVAEERASLLAEMTDLTGLENPNSTKQLLEWLKTQAYPYGSIGAKWVEKAMTSPISQAGKRGLELRQMLAKSSTSKLEALENTVSPDGALRRQYVYYGAARTGRWSGRSVQLHNLPRGTVKEKFFHAAVEAVRSGIVEQTRQFGNPLGVVSSCLRGGFRAPAGKKFVVCDLSAIENIMLGWLSGCRDILSVFEKNLDPYLDFGVRLYNRSYADLLAEYEAGNKLPRQNAKPAVLGCGYGLGGGKLAYDKNGDEIKTGLWGYSANMGTALDQEYCHRAVAVFRESYPEVVALWRRYEAAALTAIRTGEHQKVGPITFGAVKPCRLLYVILPSGRRLHYIRPKIEVTKTADETFDGREWVNISYENIVIGKTWGRVRTYGGKLTENIDQAVSRDILAYGMLRAKSTGFEICGSTHDEIIALVDEDSPLGLTELHAAMVERPTWCPDLPLAAAGYEDFIYKKG